MSRVHFAVIQLQPSDFKLNFLHFSPLFSLPVRRWSLAADLSSLLLIPSLLICWSVVGRSLLWHLSPNNRQSRQDVKYRGVCLSPSRCLRPLSPLLLVSGRKCVGITGMLWCSGDPHCFYCETFVPCNRQYRPENKYSGVCLSPSRCLRLHVLFSW